jgi:hypothetical protein
MNGQILRMAMLALLLLAAPAEPVRGAALRG